MKRNNYYSRYTFRDYLQAILIGVGVGLIISFIACIPLFVVLGNNLFSPKYTQEQAESIEFVTFEGSSTHYYEGLNDNQKKLYRSVINDIEVHRRNEKDTYRYYFALDDDIDILSTFSSKEFDISTDQVIATFYAVKYDNPSLCFNQYYDWLYSHKRWFIVLNEENKAVESDETKEAINASVKEVEALLDGVSGDYERFKIIYDYVLSKTYYQHDENGVPLHSFHTDTYIGVLDQNENTGVVCGGYAYALTYLSNVFGIDCIYLQSNNIDHAFVISKINNKWYYSDPTFDDNIKISYSNFLVSEENFWEFHFGGVYANLLENDKTYEWKHPLPKISETDYSYDKVNNLLLKISSDGSYYSIVECLDKNMTQIQIPSEYNGIPITTIGEKAFEGSSVIILSIPNSITTIGLGAFFSCFSLSYVEIPSSVTYIDKAAFTGCPNLIEVAIESESFYDQLSDEENLIFSNARILYSGSLPTEAERFCQIENDFVFCDNGVFYLCGYVGNEKEVSLPSTYKGEPYRIRRYAFTNSQITTLSVPNGVKISDYSFYKAEQLKIVALPNDLNVIPTYAFYGCSNLCDIDIPSQVTNISSNAFYECTSLKEITLPSTIVSIGNDAFYNCDSLTSVSIPASLMNLGAGAFSACSSLKEILVAKENTAFCSIDGILYSKDKKKLIQYPCAKPDKVFAFSNELNNYSFSGFYECNNIEEFKTDNNDRYVAVDGVLYSKDMKELKLYPRGKRDLSFTVPNGVEEIQSHAFSSNDYITSVFLSDSVKTLKSYSFFECGSLIRFKYGKSLTTIDKTAFLSTYIVELYDLRDGDKVIFKEGIFKIHHKMDESILTYSGDYVFANSNDKMYLVKYTGSDSEIYLPTDFEYAINSYVLYENDSVRAVHIPTNATEIKKNAFFGCSITDAYMEGRWICKATQTAPTFDTSLLSTILTDKYLAYDWKCHKD